MKRYIISISIVWIMIIFSFNAHAAEILFSLEGTVMTDPNPAGLGDVYGWNNQPFTIKITIDDNKSPYRNIVYNENLPYDVLVPESYKQASDYYADIVELKVGALDLSSYLGQTSVSMAHFIRPSAEDHLQLTLNGPSFNLNNPNYLDWYFRTRFKFPSETFGNLEIFPVPIPDDISSDSSFYFDGFVPRGDINVPITNDSIYILVIDSMSSTVTKSTGVNEDGGCFISVLSKK